MKMLLSFIVGLAICVTASAALSDYYMPLSNGTFETATYAGWSVVTGDGAWGDGPINNAGDYGIAGWDGLYSQHLT